MVEIFVWLPHGGENKSYFGHVALRVNNHTYISWWPEDFNWGWATAYRLFNNFSPHRFRTLELEISKERRPPEHNIVLYGLDEAAILDWWEGFGLNRGINEERLEIFQGPLPAYQFFNQSCSSIVATALQIGIRHDKNLHFRRRTWTPKGILDLAKSIQAWGGCTRV